MGVACARLEAPRKRAIARLGAGQEAVALPIPAFRTSILHFILAITYHILYTATMPTSHFHYVYILWDAATHTRFYVGHTSDLAARLKTHNAGHVPHTSKFAPWEIHSALAVQTEEQASEMEKYFKSHSGREWVIKHLGLPMGMKPLS